jgi:hypothetical protein
VTGGWTRSLVGIAAVVLLAAACDSSTSRAEDPIDPVAVATVPDRPFVPTQLPDGWEIADRSVWHRATMDGPSIDQMSQYLYLPPGGSAASGPAVLVGYIGDDQSAPVPCAGTDRGDPRRHVRRGVTVVEIAGPDNMTVNAAYVIGRAVDDDTMDRARSSFRWDRPRALEPGEDLRFRAASLLPASGLPALAMLHVGTGDVRRTLSIIQEDGNAAEHDVARFWESIDARPPCQPGPDQHTVFRGRTIVRLLSEDPETLRLATEVVAPGLRRVPLSEFEAG